MPEKSFIVYMYRPREGTRMVNVCAQSEIEAMKLANEKFSGWKSYAAEQEIIRYE